eukprot:3291351-Rhodomonas_salina.2
MKVSTVAREEVSEMHRSAEATLSRLRFDSVRRKKEERLAIRVRKLICLLGIRLGWDVLGGGGACSETRSYGP